MNEQNEIMEKLEQLGNSIDGLGNEVKTLKETLSLSFGIAQDHNIKDLAAQVTMGKDSLVKQYNKQVEKNELPE